MQLPLASEQVAQPFHDEQGHQEAFESVAAQELQGVEVKEPLHEEVEDVEDKAAFDDADEVACGLGLQRIAVVGNEASEGSQADQDIHSLEPGQDPIPVGVKSHIDAFPELF